MSPSLRRSVSFTSFTIAAIAACLVACSDDSNGNSGTGLQLGTSKGGEGGTSSGGSGDGGTTSGKGGSTSEGGSAGAGASSPGGAAGGGATGGSTNPGGAGGSGGKAGGSAGGAGETTDFAAAFDADVGVPSACSTCLRAKCAPENKACGDISTTGTGICRDATQCLADTYRETDPNYDCAFESCIAANPIEQVNDMFVCVSDSCATECFVTKGFMSCDQ